MSQQITWNFGVIREFPVYPSNFQQISTLEPNLAVKFVKFYGEIFIIKSATHNVSKNIFLIKIHQRRTKISSVEDRKTYEIDWNPYFLIYLFYSTSISVYFTRFAALNRRYLCSPLMDFNEKYIFGNVMSCLFYDKNFTIKFYEFHCQIWLQSWNLLKIGWVYREFSNNSEVSSNLSGHILLFWKVTMHAIQQTPKIQKVSSF